MPKGSPLSFTREQINQIQEMSFSGKTFDEIRQHFPKIAQSTLTRLAPKRFYGSKKRLLEYLIAHPDIDYNKIDFRAVNADPTSIARMIQDLRRSGIVTFKQDKMRLIRGHGQAGNTSEKAITHIEVTEIGKRRISPYASIASKVVEGQEEFNLLPPSVLDSRPQRLPTMEQLEELTLSQMPISEPELSTPIVEELFGPENATEKYPILGELRRREGRIHAANRLVDQAANLYDKADLTSEAVSLLEHVAKTQPKFSPVELELMKLAEDMGI